MSSKNCHVCQQSFAWTLETQIHYFIISRKANRRRCRWHRHTLGPNAMHVMLFILYDDRNKHRVIIIAIWKICSSLITENNVPSSISWATNTAGACVCVSECEWLCHIAGYLPKILLLLLIWITPDDSITARDVRACVWILCFSMW